MEYISKLEEERAKALSRLDKDLQGLIQSRQEEAAEKPGSEKWIFPSTIYDEEEFRQRVEAEIASSNSPCNTFRKDDNHD